MDVDRADDVAVHLADEHHSCDLEGLRVGHPQSIAELGHFAEPLHERSDLRTSAVHDNWQDPDRSQQDDILSKSPESLGFSVARLLTVGHIGDGENPCR